MSARNTSLLLVVGALILSVLLFIAPKFVPDSERQEKENPAGQKVSTDNNANLDIYLNLAKKNLSPVQKSTYDRLEKEQKMDSIATFWDRIRRPDLASVFAEKQAQTSGKAEDWMKAGNRYYYAIQFTQDKTEVPLLYQCAIRSFSKVLKIDPKNTDAKISLASCFVEGTTDPMQGISMLREIEKTDSNNIKLQLSFASFSVKSGQMDKAIERFNKVLAIDSNYIEAYLHLADAYEQQGNTGKTIEMLEKYSSKTNDETARQEVKKYIEQLKKQKGS